MVDVKNTTMKWFHKIVQGEEEIIGRQSSGKACFLIIIENQIRTKFGGFVQGRIHSFKRGVLSVQL